MLKKIKDFVKQNKHSLILVYWPIHGIWYSILQATTMSRAPIAVAVELDRLIPFNEWFVIPYALWYLQIAAVTLYLLFKNKEGFTRLYVYMFGGMFFCMLLCTVLPMYFDRTGVEMYPRDNLLTDAVRFVQGFDPPTTILPSMHVYVTLGLHMAVCKDGLGMERRLMRLASLAFSLSVCLATVFIKQHSVLDVAAALPLAAVMYFVAYKPSYKRLFTKLNVYKNPVG